MHLRCNAAGQKHGLVSSGLVQHVAYGISNGRLWDDTRQGSIAGQMEIAGSRPTSIPTSRINLGKWSGDGASFSRLGNEAYARIHIVVQGFVVNPNALLIFYFYFYFIFFLANMEMNAVVLHGARDIRVQRRPRPMLIEPDDAIVRVRYAGICGSELHPYRGHQKTTYGHIMVCLTSSSLAQIHN